MMGVVKSHLVNWGGRVEHLVMLRGYLQGLLLRLRQPDISLHPICQDMGSLPLDFHLQ
jgi:hypothetical protein